MMHVGKHDVLFAASEVYPFTKSGGLADVAQSLPKALAFRYDIAVVTPMYRFIESERFELARLQDSFAVVMGSGEYPVRLFGCRYDGIMYYFVDSPLLSDRDYLYGPPERGYEDNALRFGIFCRAVVRLCEKCGCRLLHLNDWQTALCALELAEKPERDVRTLFTIHNLAYQGTFPKTVLSELGISERHFTMEGVEFYGDVNLMKAGIAYADHVTTVSPTYAKEIMTPKFGCGLEGFLNHHRNKVSGVLNGIDTEHFSPQSDPALWTKYDARSFGFKKMNKASYLKQIGLSHRNWPLFIVITRLTWQKGIEQLAGALETVAGYPINVAMLGEGESNYADTLQRLADKHVNIALTFGYDEALSHRMYAAADFLLMPSRYEPCGLNQMIAMRYGTVPVVHAVGGLKDTVAPLKDFESTMAGGYGLVYEGTTAEILVHAIDEAVTLYDNRSRYESVCKHNMEVDNSWNRRAASYASLYDALKGEK